jgi:hypothetical protein
MSERQARGRGDARKFDRDQRSKTQTVTVMPGLAHDDDDLFRTRRVRREVHPLRVRPSSGQIPRERRWRTPSPCRIPWLSTLPRYASSFVNGRFSLVSDPDLSPLQVRGSSAR